MPQSLYGQLIWDETETNASEVQGVAEAPMTWEEALRQPRDWGANTEATTYYVET